MTPPALASRRLAGVDDVCRRCNVRRATLKLITPTYPPVDQQVVRMLLGQLYRARVRGHQAGNQELAIGHCRSALKISARREFQGALQYDLGDLYKTRIKGNRARNLRIARRYFDSALTVYSRKHSPKDWADTHRQLGHCAVRSRSRDGAERLSRSQLKVYKRRRRSEGG